MIGTSNNMKGMRMEKVNKRMYTRDEGIQRRALAASKLHAAIKNGSMPPNITWCQLCGRDVPQYRIHAHHADYDYPLSVVYLCPRHHAAIHKWIDRTAPYVERSIPRKKRPYIEQEHIEEEIPEYSKDCIYTEDLDWGYMEEE
jgi:hypothetical protein